MAKKRFDWDLNGIWDYQSDSDEYLESSKEICELLNELHEENQDLKAFNQDLSEELSVCANARISKDNQIKRLEEKIQRERNSFRKTEERWSKEAETKIKELSEENEQLKQTIENICKDYEEAHGMDIRNADWFTAW